MIYNNIYLDISSYVKEIDLRRTQGEALGEPKGSGHKGGAADCVRASRRRAAQRANTVDSSLDISSNQGRSLPTETQRIIIETDGTSACIWTPPVGQCRRFSRIINKMRQAYPSPGIKGCRSRLRIIRNSMLRGEIGCGENGRHAISPHLSTVLR